MTEQELKYVKNLDEGLRLALVNLNQELIRLQKQKEALERQRDITQDILFLKRGFEKLFPKKDEGGENDGSI